MHHVLIVEEFPKLTMSLQYPSSFAIVETRMIIDQLEKSTQKGNCVVNKGYDWMKKTDRLDW